MKSLLIFSLSMLIECTHARDLILIENLAENIHGTTLKDLLHEKFLLPKNFIKITNKQDKCKRNKESILQFCIQKNGDIDSEIINPEVFEELIKISNLKEEKQDG